jgi:hypothetical protein
MSLSRNGRNQIFEHANPAAVIDAVEGKGVAGFFAHGSLLLRVSADANTSSAPDSTVTLITLDDFAVCAREDKKEKAARMSGLSGYLCKGYPDNGHPTVIVGSSVARVNSVRLAAKESAEHIVVAWPDRRGRR